MAVRESSEWSPPPFPPGWNPEGRRVGPAGADDDFEILGDAISGGQGLVYECRVVGDHLGTAWRGRHVAIKHLRPPAMAKGWPSDELRERWDATWNTLVAVDHPHLLRHLDHFAGRSPHLLGSVVVEDDDEQFYVVSEWLDDAVVLAAASPGASRRRIWEWTVQLADALDHLHARGVIHRDVSPSNVFIGAAGAVLGDFGLARPVTGPFTELVQGTIPYMATEVLADPARASSRSDAFALGQTMYEAFTGVRADVGDLEGSAALLASALERDVERPQLFARRFCDVLQVHPALRPGRLGPWAAGLDDPERAAERLRSARHAASRHRSVLAVAAALALVGPVGDVPAPAAAADDAAAAADDNVAAGDLTPPPTIPWGSDLDGMLLEPPPGQPLRLPLVEDDFVLQHLTARGRLDRVALDGLGSDEAPLVVDIAVHRMEGDDLEDFYRPGPLVASTGPVALHGRTTVAFPDPPELEGGDVLVVRNLGDAGSISFIDVPMSGAGIAESGMALGWVDGQWPPPDEALGSANGRGNTVLDVTGWGEAHEPAPVVVEVDVGASCDDDGEPRRALFCTLGSDTDLVLMPGESIDQAVVGLGALVSSFEVDGSGLPGVDGDATIDLVVRRQGDPGDERTATLATMERVALRGRTPLVFPTAVAVGFIDTVVFTVQNSGSEPLMLRYEQHQPSARPDGSPLTSQDTWVASRMGVAAVTGAWRVWDGARVVASEPLGGRLWAVGRP